MAKQTTEPKATDTTKVENLEKLNADLTSENETLKKANEVLLSEKENLEKLNTDLTSENKTLKEVVKKEVPTKKEVITKEQYLANRPTITLDDGREFAFKFGTPNSLRVDDVVKELASLIEDKDAMEELIYGNSFFVEQVK